MQAENAFSCNARLHDCQGQSTKLFKLENWETLSKKVNILQHQPYLLLNSLRC